MKKMRVSKSDLFRVIKLVNGREITFIVLIKYCFIYPVLLNIFLMYCSNFYFPVKKTDSEVNNSMSNR